MRGGLGFSLGRRNARRFAGRKRLSTLAIELRQPALVQRRTLIHVVHRIARGGVRDEALAQATQFVFQSFAQVSGAISAAPRRPSHPALPE